MLDVRSELEGFQPIHLESIEDKVGKLPEKTVEAIHLFNKALDDAQSKNEDMAIIALKKAISLDPGFYEAMNLLGICYALVGKDEMAKSAFKQVIDADDNSLKAMSYLNKLDGTYDEKGKSTAVPVKKGMNKTSEKRSSNVSVKKSEPFNLSQNSVSYNTGSSQVNKTSSVSSVKESTRRYDDFTRESSNKPAAKPAGTPGLFGAWLARGLESEDNSLYGLKYIAGILLGVLIMAFIWYMVPTDKALLTFQRVEKVDKNPELEEQISKLNERIQKLEQEIKDRKEENLKLMDTFQNYQDWVSRLDEAEKEFLAGDFTQSADRLSNTQGMQIPEELKTRYQELWNKVRLKAADQAYREGNNLYNGNRSKDSSIYREALVQFENAITLIEKDKVNYLPVLYYQAGKAAARCDELERAVELFEAITAEFPSSQYSSYAQVRLKEISEGKQITGN